MSPKPREPRAQLRYDYETLLDEIRTTCREAREEGITPAYVGLHPLDYAKLERRPEARPAMWGQRWNGVITYPYEASPVKDGKLSSYRGSVIAVKDARVPEGRANVVNEAAAFVAGYCEWEGG